jgi:CO/xanthine dehydrogenase Mo-binding subunit
MQIVLGYESQMDELAARLGMSRTELRERNFLAKGDLLPTGERLGIDGISHCPPQTTTCIACH